MRDEPPAWRRYGAALLTVAAACGATLAAPPLQTLPAPLFFAAVTLTAFYGGLGPGLLATALSTAAIDLFFIPPVPSLAAGLEETVRVAAFALAAALINSLHERRRRAEARERAILETTLDCVITMDHTGRVIDWNPAAERLFGYRRAEAVGREVAELVVPPPLRARHRHGLGRYFATGESRLVGRRVELTGMRQDGSEFPIELALVRVPLPGAPIVRGFARDITERRRTEEAERHAATLRSVARLANAAAHEINNPLAAVVLNLDLLARQVDDSPVLRTRVERAQEAVRTIEQIVLRMAHITRLEVMPQPADLPEILDLFRSGAEPARKDARR